MVARKSVVLATLVAGVGLGGVLGAGGATWLLRSSMGSPADMQVHQLEAVRSLMVDGDRVAAVEEGHARMVEMLAYHLVLSATAFESVSAAERERLVRASRWVLSSGVLASGDDQGVAGWGLAVARCVVEHASDAPRVATCASGARPDGFIGHGAEGHAP